MPITCRLLRGHQPSLRLPTRALLAGLTLGLFCGVAQCVPLWAQQPPVGGISGPASSTVDRILVLQDGRMVEGELSQQAGGYRVAQPTGSFLIPFDRVRFTAVDRHDAYRKQRSTMPQSTVSNHLRLAQWCLSYQLLDEAETELLRAIELEPLRDEARSMLRRLQEMRPPDPTRQTQQLLENQRNRQLFGDEPAQSLAGLSRGTAADFVAKIQPILLNKCANAGCHGRIGSQRFQLVAINSGGFSHRVFAERNLAIVDQLIDRDDPLASPLLAVPRDLHAGQIVYSGPGGELQRTAVQDWVLTYVQERQEADNAARKKAERIAARTKKRTSPSHAGTGRQPANASASAVDPTGEAVPVSRKTLPAGVPHLPGMTAHQTQVTTPEMENGPPPRPLRHASAEDVRKALKAPPTDPFDPDAFNSLPRKK